MGLVLASFWTIAGAPPEISDGGNLVVNGSFKNTDEKDPAKPAAWHIRRETPGENGFACSYDAEGGGGASIRIAISRPVKGETGLVQHLKLETNTTYTASVRLKTRDLEPGGRVLFMGMYVGTLEDWKNRKLKGFDKHAGPIHGTTGWTYYKLVFTTPPVPMYDCYIYPIYLTSPEKGEVWIDEVRIVKGETDSIVDKKMENVPGSMPAEVVQKQVAVRLGEVEKKIMKLDGLAGAAGAPDLRLAGVKTSLNVARLFCEFIKADAARPNQISYAVPELARVEEILKQAEGELKTSSGRGGDVPPLEVKGLTIKNGAFYCQDKPVFLSGMWMYPCFYNKERAVRIARDLGMNLFLAFIHPDHMKGWGQFDEKGIANRCKYLDWARENDFLATCYVFAGHFPKWLAREAPDAMRQMGHDVSFDFEHPAGEKFITEWFGYLGKKFGEYSSRFCYLLYGEESLEGIGPHGVQRYEKWLAEKYKTIDELNKIWRSDYRDFGAAARENAPAASNQKRAQFYDWNVFNQRRLLRYYDAMMDSVKRSDPDAIFSRFSSNEGLMTQQSHDQVRGVDREMAVKMCPISGCDTRPFFANNFWRMCEERYSLDWITQSFGFDFMKSVAPGNPIYDPEWHSIDDGCFDRADIPAEYLRTILWMAHCHGMCAHNIWGWQRRGGEISGDEVGWGDQKHGLLTQPQLLNSWCRTMLELRSLSEHIVKFPQLPRPIKLFYSEASAIQEASYLDSICKAYEAAYFLDLPVGFMTERMIEDGALRKCPVLVVPRARYVAESVVSKLRKFAARGGKIVVMENDSLKYDEHGWERKGDGLFDGMTVLPSLPVRELSARFAAALDEAGVKREVRLLDCEGKAAWGVETRVASSGDGRRTIYMVNLNKNKVEVTLKTKRKNPKIRDLTQGRELKRGEKLALLPMNPILLEVR